MNSPETPSHPSGNFPSPKEESQMRYGFLDKNNLVLKKIRARLEKLHLKGKRNLPLNLLAFYYGVYFYNQISHNSLFPKNGEPPIKLIRNSRLRYSVGVSNNRIYYNLGSAQAKFDLNDSPSKEVEILEDPSITMPVYVSRIIDGLEEANHLHLEHLHQNHKPNHNKRSNYRSPEKLWKNSDYDPVAYRAKLWHEFAALVVQKAYLNYYVVGEYPEVVAEFNDFYNEVKKERQEWVKRKKK